MDKYIVLIGDVVDSKKIEDRRGTQRELISCLDMINDLFRDELVTKVKITQGDEFQAILSASGRVLELVDVIRLTMNSISIRWGIGVGTIETDLVIDDASINDGPAFWNARSAIDEVHANNYSASSYSYYQSNTEKETVINNVLRLEDALMSGWTSAQSQIILKIIKSYGFKDYVNMEVAAYLGITRQRVSNVIAATHYRQYRESRDMIQKMIWEDSIC